MLRNRIAHQVKEKIPFLFFMMELFPSPLIKGARGLLGKEKVWFAMFALIYLMFPLASKGEEYVFVRSWPKEILGLRYPQGVAVDGSGNVYVADGGNDRIQKFDSKGNFLTKWGALGSGDGQFYYPWGVSVDVSGNVYVADTYNYRIQKFDSEGNFLTKWGNEGSGDGQFSLPHGVSVDVSGNVYVADTYNHRIQKFDSNGNFLMKWGTLGAGDMRLSSPRGITVSASGDVYVADSGNQCIKVYRPVGGSAVEPANK